MLAAWTVPPRAWAGGDGPRGVDLAWPAGNPRVRFAGLVQPRGGPGGLVARVFRRLAGQRPAFVLERPYGVSWDGDDLLVTDPGAARVLRVGPRGRFQVSREGVFESPIGVAVCPAGAVVTDSRAGTVTLLDSELRPRRRIAEGLKRPTGVACRGEEIYVAETAAHRLRVLGPDGPVRTLGHRGTGAGEFNFPASLAVDGASLWVGDTLNFRLQRLDPASGEALEVFGRLGDAPGEMPRIKGVAVDGRGHLWVADAHLDQVALYRGDGTFLMGLGRTGALPGEFSFPAGIAAHADGRIAVVDSLNRRLQLFQPVSGAG